MDIVKKLASKYGIALICFSLFIFEIYLVAQNTLAHQVINSVPDEYVFWQHAHDLATHLANLDFYKTITFGMPADYGFMYWLLSAILLLMLPLGFGGQIMVLRIIFLSFKYLALFFLYKTVKDSKNNFAAKLLVFVFITTPGLYFYGKIFSLEYLLLAVVSGAMYILSKDKNQLGKNYIISTVLIIQAVFIKYALLPLLGISALYAIINWKRLNWRTLIVGSISTVIVSIINFPFLFTAQSKAILAKFGQNSGHFEFTLEQFKKWFFLNDHTWDQITVGGWYIDFFHGIALILLFITGVLIYRNWKDFSALGISILMIGFIYAYCISFVNPTYYWYLFAPYITLVLGIIMSLPTKKPFMIATIIVCIVVSSIGVPRILSRISHKIAINSTLAASDLATEDLRQLVQAKCIGPTTVITDTTISLNPDRLRYIKINPLIYAIWNQRSTVTAELPQTSFMLINHALVNQVQNNLNQVHPLAMKFDTSNKKVTYEDKGNSYIFTLIHSEKDIDIYFRAVAPCY